MTMETRPFTPKLPEVPESEQTPLVRSLLQVIVDLQAQNQRLEEEIRRLKGGSPRPPLKPNTLEVAVAATATDAVLPRRHGHPQRAKTAELVIHETCRVALAFVLDGAWFQSCRSYIVQDVVIRLYNTCYEREQWWFLTGDRSRHQCRSRCGAGTMVRNW